MLASGRRRLRPALLACGLATALALASAGPAAATDIAATCSTLQAQLDTVQSGDVVTLDSSDGPSGLCSSAYTLRTNPPGTQTTAITLKGDSSDANADGFDGTLAVGRVLTGVDVHRLEINDLVFRDSTSATNGGAIAITGDSQAAVRTSKFFNNHADSGHGGAVYIAAKVLARPRSKRYVTQFARAIGITLTGQTG